MVARSTIQRSAKNTLNMEIRLVAAKKVRSVVTTTHSCAGPQTTLGLATGSSANTNISRVQIAHQERRSHLQQMSVGPNTNPSEDKGPVSDQPMRKWSLAVPQVTGQQKKMSSSGIL